jgi:hypothetical protein
LRDRGFVGAGLAAIGSLDWTHRPDRVSIRSAIEREVISMPRFGSKADCAAPTSPPWTRTKARLNWGRIRVEIRGDANAPEAQAILRFLLQGSPTWWPTDQLGPLAAGLSPEEALPHIEALYVAEMVDRQELGPANQWRAVPSA